jgi:SPX domain protein involved in polyphosphate accumulation
MATAPTKQSAKDADAQEFDRKTTKYWVHPVDIPQVKKILGKNLPEYRFSTKISKMVQSLYFDNDDFKMYYDRVMLLDKGKIFRYRWYGQGVPPLGFMEQKIRRLGWLNNEKSVKRRIKMSNQLAKAYIKGEFVPTEANSSPPLAGESLALGLELQREIMEGGLKPVIRTAYIRSCYQKDFDSPLRVSFDEELQFTICVNNDFLLMDSEDLQKRLLPHQKYDFPHAILEIKVRLSGEGRSQLPPWCQDLIDRKLITAMDKFSKFNTAVGVFFS